MTQRYQNGEIARIDTPTAPLTGTLYRMPTDAIGNALQDLGDQGVRLYQAYERANDARQLMEAERDMQTAVLDFAKWQAQSQDESMWLPEWEKRTQSLQKSFGDRKLSDNARLGLQRSFSNWHGNQMLSLQTQAVKQAGFRARQAASNTIKMAVDSGDEGRANAAISLLEQSGNALPEEVEAMRLAVGDKIKAKRIQNVLNLTSAALDERNLDGARELIRTSELDDSEKRKWLAQIDATHAVNEQKDQFQAIALRDPQAALKDLDNPAKFALLSPGDREAARAQAKNILAGQSLDAFRDIKARIDLGQVKKEENFDAFKELDPLMRDQLRAYNAAFHDKAGMNSPAVYESAIEAIDNLVDDGSGLPRAQLEAAIESQFNGPYAEQLKKRLNDKFSNPGKTEVLKEALAQLNRWGFDEKRFGEYQKPMLGPDGNPVITEKDIKTQAPDYGILGWRQLFGMGARGTTVETFKDQPQPVMVDEPAKRDAIAAKIGMIRTQLEKEVSEGKILTPDDAMKRAAELSGQPRVKSAASQIGPSPLLPSLSAQPRPLMPIQDEINAILSKNANR